MKVHFHVRGLPLSPHSRQCLEQSLGLFRTLIPISVAAIVLEHRRGDSPPFRAFASLAVTGPDIQAEARDQTLWAAWLKVLATLREHVQRRTERHEWRDRTIVPPRGRRPRRPGPSRRPISTAAG